ncbi:MAG: aminotransferase class V-fold PLP-dependent enzyme [Cyclobacteriaceae bacterium]
MKNSYQPTSRRRFLKKTLAGASLSALPVSLSAENALLLSIDSVEEGEAYWRQIRQQFGLRPNLILMNAANLCPSPRAVSEAVYAGTQDLDYDASFHNRKKFGELRTELRSKLANYLNVSIEEITLTRNTSESNNTIVQGLPLKEGDEVVLWEQNHPTNLLVWQVQARRTGFTVKVVSTPENPASPQELIDPFLQAFTPRTRLLSFSHISNTTGVAMPDELCKIAREKGILSMVDGAQSFGSRELDLSAIGCDFYTSSAHKWFLGPREMGILYVRQPLISELWPHLVAAGYEKHASDDIERLSSLGQQDIAKIPAFSKAVEFHEAIGQKQIAQRISSLASQLKEQIQSHFPQATLVTPVTKEMSGGVVIAQFPEQNHVQLFNQLYEQHHIACAPTGGLRFSPTIYNTPEEVTKVMDALTTLVS